MASSAARRSGTVAGNNSSTTGLSRPLSATMLANSASFETKWAYSVALDTPACRATASMLTAP